MAYKNIYIYIGNVVRYDLLDRLRGTEFLFPPREFYARIKYGTLIFYKVGRWTLLNVNSAFFLRSLCPCCGNVLGARARDVRQTRTKPRNGCADGAGSCKIPTKIGRQRTRETTEPFTIRISTFRLSVSRIIVDPHLFSFLFSPITYIYIYTHKYLKALNEMSAPETRTGRACIRIYIYVHTYSRRKHPRNCIPFVSSHCSIKDAYFAASPLPCYYYCVSTAGARAPTEITAG